MERYNSLNSFLRRRYGCKVYRLLLSGGMGCPNRDGTISSQGCIFCKNGNEAFSSEDPDEAKGKIKDKARSDKYIAYYGTNCGTYAPTDYLRKLYTGILEQPDIVGLSIATRPDCLDESKLELLSDLNRIKPVTVEFGLQTSNENTASYIRRGYKNAVFDKAVSELKSRGVETAAHLILCLPGETVDDMKRSAVYAAAAGVNGVKLQLLHVLRGTDLEKDYIEGRFALPELAEYAEILSEVIRTLPPDIIIYRLTGDGAKSDLIAPLWSADKKRVINYINRYFDENNVIQGEKSNAEKSL